MRNLVLIKPQLLYCSCVLTKQTTLVNFEKKYIVEILPTYKKIVLAVLDKNNIDTDLHLLLALLLCSVDDRISNVSGIH